MKFGLAYNTAYFGTDPDLMAAAAQHAEQCGFESFYTSEHIVMYPGATAYSMPLPPDLAVVDPLECLAYVAAATSTLLLGTAVLLLPYHHPVVLAKRLATIDVLQPDLTHAACGPQPFHSEVALVPVTTAGGERRASPERSS